MGGAVMLIMNKIVLLITLVPEAYAFAFYAEIHRLHLAHVAAGSPKSGVLNSDVSQ
jgi:hypothetical protein